MLFLTAEAADVSALSLDYLQILIRLVCAMVVGTVIGIEREYTHRPAGLRTHILVALGACSVMIVGQLIFAQYKPFGATSDPARLAAQVVSGVGFLGAGTIMREGVNVKGLTTAASLWAVACLGIAAGGGYFDVAIIGTVLMFITLTLLEVFQNLLLKGTRSHNKDYDLVCTDVSAAINAINHAAENCSCRVSNFRVEEENDTITVRFYAEFGAGGRKRRQQKFIDLLNVEKFVISVGPTPDPVSV